MSDFGSRSLDCPSSSWFGFSFYPCFIPIPELDLWIVHKVFQSFYKLFSCFVILSVRPGFGYFQNISFLMKKAKDCVVRALKGIFISDVSMEGRGRPEGSLSPTRLLKFLDDLLFLFTRNKPFSSAPLLRDKSIHAIVVEGLDDLLYGTFRQINCLHHLFSRRADEKHDNDKASSIRLPVASLTYCLEIGQGGIFGVGNEITLRHDSYIGTTLVKCLEISTANRNYF